MKICIDIRKSRYTTGINNTCGKFATGVSYTSGKFATGINENGGPKFFADLKVCKSANVLIHIFIKLKIRLNKPAADF